MLPLALLVCSPCAPPPGTHSAGTVAIVAGEFAFDEQDARALCPDADARLCLAIGAPAAGAVDVFAALGSPTPRVRIDPGAAYPGDDRELVSRAGAARSLVLAGGTWLEWWSVLRPGDKLSRLGQCVVDAHRGGVTILGVGQAGACLGRWSVVSRAHLQRPSRDPHDVSLDVRMPGLGLSALDCIDMQIDTRDSPERLLAVLSGSEAELALWLAGSCAWIEDGDRLGARLSGSAGAACVFDLEGARRSRTTLSGGRLHVLWNGGRFEARSRPGPGGTIPAGIESAPASVPATLLAAFGSLNGIRTLDSVETCTLEGAASRMELAPLGRRPARYAIAVAGAFSRRFDLIAPAR